MRVEPSTPGELLAELQALLASDQLPVQEKVAEATGVHQSLVSRARNGQLRRMTDKVEALLEYARSRVGDEERAVAAAEEVDADLVAEPEPRLAADRPVSPASRSARHQSDPAAEGYRRQARDGVETYLDEGYDPRLIVEQLAVLRRAQRLRRSGPLPRGSAVDPAA